MQYETILTFLCRTDSFWKYATVDVIYKLSLVSKELKKEMTYPVIEHALLTMVGTSNLVLQLSDAKYRFSLTVDEIIEHCIALPVGHRCHLRAIYAGPNTLRELYTTIPFVDAYRLMVNRVGGVRGAMEQRLQFDSGIRESLCKFIDKYGEVFNVISCCIDYGIHTLRTYSRTHPFRMLGIGGLVSLRSDINGFLFEMHTMHKKSPFKAYAIVFDLNDRAPFLISNYRDFCLSCPIADMPVEFVAGFLVEYDAQM